MTKVRSGLTHVDFMEPKGSSPFSQQPTIGSYPEPDHSSPRVPIYLLGTSSSSKWSLYFGVTHQNSVRNSLLPRTCYMPHSCHPPCCITQRKSGKQYDTWSYSPYGFIHSPVTSYHSGQISHSAPYSRTPLTHALSLVWETKFHTHTYTGSKSMAIDSEYRITTSDFVSRSAAWPVSLSYNAAIGRICSIPTFLLTGRGRRLSTALSISKIIQRWYWTDHG